MKSKLDGLLQGIADGELMRATLSSPLEKIQDGTHKITIRTVSLKGKPMYQCSEYVGQKVLHRNFSFEEGCRYIEDKLKLFKQGVFSLNSYEYHVLAGKGGHLTIMKKPCNAREKCNVLPDHNFAKKHILPEGIPVPFLVHLGIMSSEGKVSAKKYDKFRQINRFLEMVRDIASYLPSDRPVRIVDFGCGKAYLTFALHHYLHHILKLDVDITGLDLKADVVAHCNSLAEALKIKHLKFIETDILSYTPTEDIDLMISLHACDTATDAALFQSMKWKAKVILCVPCCQHELYKQVQSDALASLLQHGILRERFAALATDAARAELLAMNGYDVQVLEFIDMEHTPKNLLIRAVKSDNVKKSQAAKMRYETFKGFLHITPALDRLVSG